MRDNRENALEVSCENHSSEKQQRAQKNVEMNASSRIEVEFVENDPRNNREVYGRLLNCLAAG